MKIICMVSGGIDSSVMLYMLQKSGNDVLPLFVNYGQKSAKHELTSVKKLCDELHLSINMLELESLSEIKCGLTSPDISAIDFPYFPGRNLILSSIGISFAHNHASQIIAFGFLKQSIFPDQNENFIKNMENTAKSALNDEFKILSPFIDMDKRDIVNLAKKYNFSLDLTYSCHSGTSVPCGKCIGCIEREKVMIK